MPSGHHDELDASLHLHTSINKVLRRLKRQELGLYNCICSLLSDTAFVKEIAGLYAALPLVANLRCGLWYTPQRAGTCYFKSTDGHYGNWSFSLTRLNLHIALLAARQGGCLIVDATRRGKAFPDAFTKTVPIWAAVLNRAVASLREGCTLREPTASLSPSPAPWDEELHLPPWISANEANNIRACLDRWTEQLLQVGVDVAALAAQLRKPLRPLWVSQNSLIWLDQVPDLADLDFTPLLLISASLPNARQRRIAGQDEAGQGGWTYEYVPGAGDDEESWAKGLSPSLLWQHQQELVDAGPDGVAAVVERLVCSSSDACSSWCSAGAEDSGSHDAVTPTSNGAAHPLHRLPPLGVRGSAGSSVCSTGDGLFWIAGTGIAVGSFAAGAPPEVWRHARAVLNSGAAEHPGMASEQRTQVALRRPLVCLNKLQEEPGALPNDSVDVWELAGPATRYLHLPVQDAKHARRGLQARLPAALQFASAHLAAGRRLLIHCADGLDICVCIAVALLLACYRGGSPGSGLLFEAPFLPAPSSPLALERPNSPLEPQNPSSALALEHPGTAAVDVSSSKERGALEGAPASVGAPAGRAASASAPGNGHAGDIGETLAGAGQAREDLSSRQEKCVQIVDKADVRRRLAHVSASYPAARPTRGSLRQVYNFFQQHSLALGAVSADDYG